VWFVLGQWITLCSFLIGSGASSYVSRLAAAGRKEFYFLFFWNVMSVMFIVQL
jgi:hypothetical protein